MVRGNSADNIGYNNRNEGSMQVLFLFFRESFVTWGKTLPFFRKNWYNITDCVIHLRVFRMRKILGKDHLINKII